MGFPKNVTPLGFAVWPAIADTIYIYDRISLLYRDIEMMLMKSLNKILVKETNLAFSEFEIIPSACP